MLLATAGASHAFPRKRGTLRWLRRRARPGWRRFCNGPMKGGNWPFMPFADQ